ncbi:MAG: LD-carboxypeptidase [Chitinophagales bacterium]
MLRRFALQSGDKIGIAATARFLYEEELKPALEILGSWGYEVVVATNAYTRDGQFAGDDRMRATTFQAMLDDPSIRAIFCARGGYGTIRIMDLLDFHGFAEHPKLICGYSDVTVLLTHINGKLGLPGLHCAMPFSFAKTDHKAMHSMQQALQGGQLAYTIQAHPLNKYGYAKAVCIGGNLSILYALLGTKYGFNTGGCILFIEDIDEYLYHIDRMMMSMLLAGKLDALKGVVVGAFTDMKDNKVAFGKPAEEILDAYFGKLGIPVVYGFPAGHIENNNTLVLGDVAELEVSATGALLRFNLT